MKMNALNIVVFGLVMNTIFALVIAQGIGNDFTSASETLDGREAKSASSLDYLSSEQNTGAAGTSTNDVEKVWGSATGIGSQIMTILFDAINPFSFNKLIQPDDHIIEQVVANGIKWFRILYSALMALAVYNMFFNKTI